MQPQCILRWQFWVGIVALTVVGCPQRPVSGPPRPLPSFAGATVSIRCPAGTARRLIDRHSKSWATAQQATISFSDDRPDLIVFAPAEMGRLVVEGKLVVLPDSIVESDLWLGLLRQQRDKLLIWGDKPYALPLLADATVIVYRADLYGKAKRRPPTTFAEFAEQARQWSTERNQPSLPPLPSDVDGLDREFFTAAAAFAVAPVVESDVRGRANGDAAAAYAFHFNPTDGSSRLTDPGFVKALEWLSSLQSLRSVAASFTAAFTNDQAVLGFATPADLASLKPGANPGRYGVVAIPNAPSGQCIPYVGPGGSVAAVSKSATNPAASLDLLKHLADPARSMEVVHDPSFGSAPFRRTHLAEQRRDGWYSYGFDASGTNALLDALRAAVEPRVINTPVRLRVPDEAERRAAVLKGVRECLERGGDPAKTMAEIDASWRALDAKRPAADRIADGQRSLGLKP